MTRRRSFVASVLVHALLALILLMAPAAAPIRDAGYQVTPLLLPARPPTRTGPPPRERTLPVAPRPMAISLHRAPSPALPAEAAAELPPPVIPLRAPASVSPPPLEPPRLISPPPVIHTGLFAALQPPSPMPAERPLPVPTGAFTAPLHVADANRSASAAPAGSSAPGAFAAPVHAPDATRSSPGRAPAGGFDAAQVDRPAEVPHRLRPAGFSVAVAQPAPAAPPAAPSRPETQLEILSKPRPAYSTEARRLAIEGEVVLEALFRASGEIRVLRVVGGLGHGLDENAVQAATAIRFRPAMANGMPIDTVATVRIRFQLAL